ncbi:MAG: OsmC family protein [Roseovarius sp.]
MRNNIPTVALSEFVNEVADAPEEGVMRYGIEIEWESGTRSNIQTKPMLVGPHRVSRSFSWKADEPRQLMGNNHGPNPQELLMSGLGSCMMVSFIAGATAAGVQLDSVKLDFEGELDLRGFFGLGTNAAIGFPQISYKLHVTGDATPEKFEDLHRKAVAHSPNAQTIINPVQLTGEVISTQVSD